MDNIDLALCWLSRQKREEDKRERNRFLISNTYCKIISKRIKTHIFKKDEYFLRVQGLDTGEEMEIQTTDTTYKECHRLIQFAGNKAALSWEVFKEKNKKQGMIVIEKYSSKEDNLFLMKLHGVDSDTCEIYNFPEENFNSTPLGAPVNISEDRREEDVLVVTKEKEDCWYNVPGYDTFDIESMIENSDDDAYLYAYYKDASLPNTIHNFTISTETPQNSNYYYIKHQGEIIEDVERMEDWSEEKKDSVRELFFQEFNISTQEEYNERLVKQFVNGCVRIKIAALKRYPVQTRQNFCIMINSIWGIPCWYGSVED